GRKLRPIGDALAGLVRAMFNLGLTLIFLAHQALISFDAVLRTYYRRLVSRQRLLEWETAAQAELETGRRTFVDVLLNWTPLVALEAGGCAGRGSGRVPRPAPRDLRRASRPGALGRQQAGELVAESSATADAQGCDRARPPITAPHGAVHLALLRDLQQCRAQL